MTEYSIEMLQSVGYRWGGGKGNPPVNFICLLPDWDSGGGGGCEFCQERRKGKGDEIEERIKKNIERK